MDLNTLCLYFISLLCLSVQCRSEISEQRRRKINARNTRIRVFFDASKIAYRRRVCAFVIHNRNFAFPVIVYEDKRINCVTADKSKIYICMYVALITNQFRSANAADENLHRALLRSLISFKCNKGLERRAKLNQQIMPRKTEAMIFVSVCRDALQSFHDNLLPTRAKKSNFSMQKNQINAIDIS